MHERMLHHAIRSLHSLERPTFTGFPQQTTLMVHGTQLIPFVNGLIEWMQRKVPNKGPGPSHEPPQASHPENTQSFLKIVTNAGSR